MIKKPSELTFEDKKLSMIIAGVPGIGKTTLALSSPKPLLIDLDDGVSRVEAIYRKDTDIVQDYEELVNDLKTNDLSNYETIIIDTGGKLLEMMKPVVIKENVKNGKTDGNLSLQGYGAVKKKFKEFINFVKSLDKNVIIVFHATEVSLSNDVTGLRIRMEGGAKDEIWDDIDIGGFVEIVGKDRKIGFSNCERYYAKGTHGVHGTYLIPELKNGSKNTFITDLFSKVKADLKQETEIASKYTKAMEIKPKIDNTKDLKELNDCWNVVKDEEHYLTSKNELWFALTEKAKQLGAIYDKESNAFIQQK